MSHGNVRFVEWSDRTTNIMDGDRHIGDILSPEHLLNISSGYMWVMWKSDVIACNLFGYPCDSLDHAKQQVIDAYTTAVQSAQRDTW